MIISSCSYISLFSWCMPCVFLKDLTIFCNCGNKAPTACIRTVDPPQNSRSTWNMCSWKTSFLLGYLAVPSANCFFFKKLYLRLYLFLSQDKRTDFDESALDLATRNSHTSVMRLLEEISVEESAPKRRKCATWEIQQKGGKISRSIQIRAVMDSKNWGCRGTIQNTSKYLLRRCFRCLEA